MSKQRRVGALNIEGYGCVVEQAIPELKKGEILVEVHASVVSPGTELVEAKKARVGKSDFTGDPYVFGYQNAGVVLEVNDISNGLKPGDRVVCMGSGYALHTDYAVMPQNLCIRMPDDLSYDKAAMAHLAATALHAVRRGGTALGERLVVVGLGLVGQMAARLGQIAGMYVMGWDMSPFRCDVAKGWGIDETAVIGKEDEVEKSKAFNAPLGFDMAVVAYGGKVPQALKGIKATMKTSVDGHAMGRICIVGGLVTDTKWATGMGNLDVRSCSRTGPGYHDDAWEHGETAYPPCFVRWNTKTNMEYVLQLMVEGKLDVDSLISHRLPLDKIDEAVSLHIEHPNETLGTVLLMKD
jgi:NADPH2:quinone reductase